MYLLHPRLPSDRSTEPTKQWRRIALGLFTATILSSTTLLPAHAANLPINPEFMRGADIGFHDYTRTGADREIRGDLSGSLQGMIEFVQASTSAPIGNADTEMPTTVAERETLLLFTPTTEVENLSVEVRTNGEVQGTVELAHPRNLPASDQTYDKRGTVAYSLRAWSAVLPFEWVKPGMELTFTDEAGNIGHLSEIDIAAPNEIVINNIRLGMLSDAPVSEKHHFIENPADGATDYFQTIPVSKMTMAQYETVELDEVIVASGDIYTLDNPDPSIGSVYAGTMRENVGKAQVSTGINLATWGITSAEMTQRHPGATNQRVIHHSAGLYSNGVQTHGLSGGNGMATLQTSVGNELSHELGHSYGLGHFPGQDNDASGDDIIRNASHHMDSGWGYIAYRDLMRSNLTTRDYEPARIINDVPFSENLQGKYNFNTDTMAGGWDDSPVSDYTHMTGYSLKRTQEYLQTLVADTSYPSGYRDWDDSLGQWVDAKVLNPDFDMAKPKKVGGHVYTILGGYNPADPGQTLVYPAFRSNYGVTFDLPQADTTSTAAERVCWLNVDFLNQPTQHIKLDATDGIKQLNVNIAEEDIPTAAQVACRTGDETTLMGNVISIDTNPAPMPEAVVVGQDAGFEALRTQELNELEPLLESMSTDAVTQLPATEMIKLRGWSDDLSQLSPIALEAARELLTMDADLDNIKAFLDDPATDSPVGYSTLVAFLKQRGYVESEESVLPAGQAVTVDNGRCLYVDDAGSVLVDPDVENCADNHDDTWFLDVDGRIHLGEQADQCLVIDNPVRLESCSPNNINQRWLPGEPDEQGARTFSKASDTKWVMDYHRQGGYPSMYINSGTPNQFWLGMQESSNPILGSLDGKVLDTLWNAVDNWNPSVEPLPLPEEPEDEITPPDVAPARGSSDNSFGSSLLGITTLLGILGVLFQQLGSLLNTPLM